jgi:hypothetical protein
MRGFLSPYEKVKTTKKGFNMGKFIVKATLTRNYEIPVEAETQMDAIKKLDDWISDDFEDFEVTAGWDFFCS